MESIPSNSPIQPGISLAVSFSAKGLSIRFFTVQASKFWWASTTQTLRVPKDNFLDTSLNYTKSACFKISKVNKHIFYWAKSASCLIEPIKSTKSTKSPCSLSMTPKWAANPSWLMIIEDYTTLDKHWGRVHNPILDSRIKAASILQYVFFFNG